MSQWGRRREVSLKTIREVRINGQVRELVVIDDSIIYPIVRNDTGCDPEAGDRSWSRLMAGVTGA
jgi:hypothetical protein